VREFLDSISSYYLALILVVGVGIAFYSLLKLTMRAEHEQLLDMGLSLAYAVQLQPDLEPHEIDSLQNSLSRISGVTNIELEQPIPQWNGPDNQADEWQSMWERYLPPMLVATSELQAKNYIRAPEIAEEIESVSGVAKVVWDATGHAAQASMMQNRSRKFTFLTTLFWTMLLASVVGLISSYPERLRRHNVVRLGFGGAGSHYDPDSLWIRIALTHAGLTVAIYFIIFTLGYLFFPLPLENDGSPGYFMLVFEGLFLGGVISAAICIVGWWLYSEPLDSNPAYRPPRVGDPF